MPELASGVPNWAKQTFDGRQVPSAPFNDQCSAFFPPEKSSNDRRGKRRVRLTVLINKPFNLSAGSTEVASV